MSYPKFQTFNRTWTSVAQPLYSGDKLVSFAYTYRYIQLSWTKDRIGQSSLGQSSLGQDKLGRARRARLGQAIVSAPTLGLGSLGEASLGQDRLGQAIECQAGLGQGKLG